MKWSSTSGSLISLSQWLHTHFCSGPSPCCPLSAGLGSPSLRKSYGRDSPMRKCLKSWTEGKSILSIQMSRGRGGGGRGGGAMGWRSTRRCIEGSWDVICYGLCLLPLTSPPYPTGLNLLNGGCSPCGLGVRESRAGRLCVFVSVSGTASDAAHRSRTEPLSVQ